MVATTPGAPAVRRRGKRTDDGVVTVGRSRSGNVVANTVGVVFSLLMLGVMAFYIRQMFKIGEVD